MSDFATNLARAETYLARFRRDGVMNHIAGQPVPAIDGTTFESLSPIDRKPMARVARGKATDIAAAAAAAKAAFPAWRAMEGDRRKALLHRIADAIEARAEEIALVEAMDTGQSIRFMAKAALRGAENFRYFADLAPTARDGQTLRAGGQVNMTGRSPIGPVGIITPWNTPFMLSTWKIAPALAAGCTVVHKPAEFSPLSARLLIEIAESAGLPPGVWNPVTFPAEGANVSGSSAQIRHSMAWPRRFTVSPSMGIFSPAAIMICIFTRSSPVTISVTGCSTWMRVFISRK